MTQLCFWRDSQGDIIAFAAVGHSGYAPMGRDIVCAGVSALTQAAVNALETVAGHPPRVMVKAGLLWCTVPDQDETAKHDTQVILRFLAQGLEDMVKAYPRHLKMIWKERRRESCFK